VLDQYNCTSGDEFTTLAKLGVKCEGLSPSVLGAATITYQEEAPDEGELLIFDVNSVGGTHKRLGVIARTPVYGCVYALTSIHGMIAAARDTAVSFTLSL
jgi:hypothetical protein